MLKIDDRLSIPLDEFRWEFSRSGGPGGQNVNKVATAVQLRFDAGRSAALPEAVKIRLATLAGRRMTSDGVLIIMARRFRSQDRNREDALARLVALIREAAERIPPRRPTRPSFGERQRRLEAKGHRAAIKRSRRSSHDE